MNIKTHFLYSVEHHYDIVVPLLSDNLTWFNIIYIWNQGDVWYVVCVYWNKTEVAYQNFKIQIVSV